MTLRSYQDILVMSDNLRSHPFYLEAAFLAIEIYLSLHDAPIEQDLNQEMENMSLSEKKKAQRKAKKEQLKNAQESSLEKNQDDDPQGLKYLQGDPLMNAMPFVSSLLQFSPENIKAQVLAAKIYMRRSKSFNLS